MKKTIGILLAVLFVASLSAAAVSAASGSCDCKNSNIKVHDWSYLAKLKFPGAKWTATNLPTLQIGDSVSFASAIRAGVLNGAEVPAFT